MPNGDSQQQRHQAGRLRPLRRHQPLPGQRPGAADQDGPGRQARRRRPAARRTRSIPGSPRSATPRRASGLISPPPHHDIYSIEDLAELIHDLKNANHARAHQRQAGGRGRRRHHRRRRGQGARRRGADQRPRRRHRRLAAHRASSTPACPGNWAWPRRTRRCVLNNLRSRIVVETDGQLKTGRDVVIAALLGAEEFGFATAPLVALGCIMMRVCHLNTCPVGVATQDPRAAQELHRQARARRQLHALHRRGGARADGPARLPHRSTRWSAARDRLEIEQGHRALEGAGPGLLADPLPAGGRARASAATARMPQDHGLDKALDNTMLLQLCEPALETRRAGRGDAADPQRQPRRRHDARQRDHPPLRRRAACPRTRSSCTSTARPARASAPSCPRGMTLELEGDANDYVGKGLSGGKIIVYPPAAARPSSPRRTSSSATWPSTARPAARPTSAAWPASASASATAASTPSSKASATTAAST